MKMKKMKYLKTIKKKAFSFVLILKEWEYRLLITILMSFYMQAYPVSTLISLPIKSLFKSTINKIY